MLVAFAGMWLQWSCKAKSNMLGCKRSFRSFSLAGDRMDAERPIPNSQVSFICNPSPSQPPPTSRVAVEIIIIYIDNIFQKVCFWSSRF